MAPRSVAKTSKAPKVNPGEIFATSQQSRFHAETLLDNAVEIDLKDVTVAIGENELISSSHLRLKQGVRYGLIGRNGSGKSTLFKAISDKLIPGLGRSIRILLLSQVDDSARATLDNLMGSTTVLQHVTQGDKARLEALKKFEQLTQAVEATSLQETHRIVSTIRLSKLRDELVEARKIAVRRSGARGKEARLEEIRAEKRVEEAEQRLHLPLEEISTTVMDEAVDMLTKAQATLDMLDAATTESRASIILVGLGFSPEMIAAPYMSLSGGWRSRCSLATSLLVHCDVLILDEPTNFLDLEATLWLESYLTSSQSDRTVLLTSHDQSFLDNVVEETIILRHKTLKYFEGTPSAFEVNERKERRKSRKLKEGMDKKKDHIQKSIREGLATAKKTGDDNRMRMAKSRQKKLDERWGIETSAKGGRFKLNRDLEGYHLTARAEVTEEEQEERVSIRLPQPDKLRTAGDLVHFDNVAFGHKGPKGKMLLEGVTFTVEQGGRCVFVGANGQGKSTLAKLILGELKPTRGTISLHPLIRIGYFSQHSVDELSVPSTTLEPNSGSPKVTALSYFMEHVGETVDERDARACLGSLGLRGKIASDVPLEALSGGQKVRLAFALIIYHPPPLLLLDEITTHVDAPTIKSLALALRSYQGGIILVSHDRWFSRVVIEGTSPRALYASDDVSDSESSSDDSDSENLEVPSNRIGRTYRVGGGKIKHLEGGMVQYVGIVERKIARMNREKERLALAEK